MQYRIFYMLVCFIVATPLQLNAATSYTRSQLLLDKLDQKSIRMNLWRQRINNALTQGVQNNKLARTQSNHASEAMLGVIISFDQLRRTSSQTNAMQKGQQKQAARLQHKLDLFARQNTLTRGLKVNDFAGLKKIRGIKKFKYTSGMAMTVNRSTLEALLQNPFITVSEDKPYKMFLDQSVPIVYPSHATSVYTGNNEWAVAIIDSGVDTGHPFLAGKLISEACYSTRDFSQATFEETLAACNDTAPDGEKQSTAAGSGEACDSNFAGCGHGTHVAGVAVGSGSSLSPVKPDGVAKTGKIISIKVVSLLNDVTEDRCTNAGFLGKTQCAVMFPSDVIRGLERVYDLRNTFKIAAVNLSAGVGSASGFCDSENEQEIIASLRDVGIATVVASGTGEGNVGAGDAISVPACVSSAIAVGSSTDTDAASSFSNSSVALDLYAPGENVESSVLSPEDGYGLQEVVASSTSVAAAHVAGAWAVVKSKTPSASVSQIEALFDAHGPDITKSGETRKRIDLDGVLEDSNIEPSGGLFFPIRAKNGKTVIIFIE